MNPIEPSNGNAGLPLSVGLPLWSIIPFVCVLLCIALLPAFFPRFWRKYHTVILSALCIPVLALSAAMNLNWILHGFADYVSFICLLGALYAVGGGLYVHGAPKANPVTNLQYMAFGAILASIIGTLGASMLLIRPLIRSNRGRKHQTHVIIFFIFIVSNVGGLLTPLGDPPLLLGYLKGVPFWWALKLFPIWLSALTFLLGVFLGLDTHFYLNDPDFRGPLKQDIKAQFKIIGRWNLVLIPVIIASLLVPQMVFLEYPLWQVALRVFMLIVVIYACHMITPKQILTMNNFSWEPFKEVAIIFAGIFVTMIPALKYLESHATDLGMGTQWAFYWLSGIFSGVLDNAPTYASFFAVAQGLGKDFAMLTLNDGLTISEPLLIAVTAGSVLFGALTYIGNAPNLLVKALADEEGIHMPSFFGYLLWSISFLLPVLFLIGIFFFE
jgi:Na+/H+ antiporter NhaD/arsenite permease-like protein